MNDHGLERLTGLLSVALALVVLAPTASAEIAAETTPDGAYWRTVARGNASTKNLRIWGMARESADVHPLNPGGDVNGDLWPAILEVPQDGMRPFVVWSRFNGYDFDLAWSRWNDDTGWAEIRWVAGPVPAPGDDLDPVLAGDPVRGRPHAVWWRDVGGRGEVYLSLFLVHRWMQPYLVSDAGEDARFPSVELLDETTIRITYETPAGTRVRVVKFHPPTTITDDLNPLEYLKNQASSLAESQSVP